MEPDFEKSLTVPTPGGPKFRPAKGYLIVVGILIVALFLLTIAIVWAGYGRIPWSVFENLAPVLKDSLRVSILNLMVLIGVFSLLMLILGIGSMGLRKWARDLLQAIGWCTIGYAALTAVTSLFTMPQQLAINGLMSGGSLPAGGGAGSPAPVMPNMEIFMIVAMIVGVVINLVSMAAPGVLLAIIYGMKNVELTTRYYDQRPCWTEHLSLKVRILWVWLIANVLFALSIACGWPELMTEFKLASSPRAVLIFTAICSFVPFVISFGVAKAAKWSWWATLIYFAFSSSYMFYFYTKLDIDAINQVLVEVFNLRENFEEEADLQIFLETAVTEPLKALTYTVAITALTTIVYLFWCRHDFFPQPEAREGEAAIS